MFGIIGSFLIDLATVWMPLLMVVGIPVFIVFVARFTSQHRNR